MLYYVDSNSFVLWLYDDFYCTSLLIPMKEFKAVEKLLHGKLIYFQLPSASGVCLGPCASFYMIIEVRNPGFHLRLSFHPHASKRLEINVPNCGRYPYLPPVIPSMRRRMKNSRSPNRSDPKGGRSGSHCHDMEIRKEIGL